MRYHRNPFCRTAIINNNYILVCENKVYKLNESGLEIWKELEGGSDVNSLKNRLLSKYKNVCEAQLLSDLENFLELLEKRNAVYKYHD